MTQDWDEIKALQESLREHMAEIKRLNEYLIWKQHRAEHVGTHGPGCATWGPKHYECLLRAYNAMKERTSQESRQVEPVAYVTGFTKGRCTIALVDPAWIPPVGMALYRSPPNQSEDALGMVEPVAWMTHGNDLLPLFHKNKQAAFGWGANPRPLYTTPPKREPLTDEEISMIFIYCGRDKETFARAIERAHGIGGEK